MSKDAEAKCTDFTVTGRPSGHAGYFSACNSGCEPGYKELGRCNGRHNSCSKYCRNQPSCAAGSNGRAECLRLPENYKTEKEKTTLDQCCGISDKSVRDQRDCPFTAFPGSSFCDVKIKDFCINDAKPENIINPLCKKLEKMGEVALNNYNKGMEKYCMASIDNLHQATCVDWCKSHPALCTKPKLNAFCSTEKAMGNPDYADICGCFYPDTVYAAARETLAKNFSVPEGVLGGGRKCYFPRCDSARIQFEAEDYKCPSLNLVNCIQNIDINAQNAKIDKIEIKQSAQCGQFAPRGTPGAPGSPSSPGAPGSPGAPSAAPPATAPPATPPTTKWYAKKWFGMQTFIWIIIGVIILCCICSCCIFFLTRKTSDKAKSSDGYEGSDIELTPLRKRAAAKD
jgi:hypothetical protein